MTETKSARDCAEAGYHELARTLEILYRPGTVVELRAFKDGTTFSGYYDDHNRLARDAAKQEKLGYDVYVTINELPEAIAYRRYNRNDKIKGRDVLTADNDVQRRTYLFIDADPQRLAGISSTDEEKAQSWQLVQAVRAFLRELGWTTEPIVCDSGNGYHLLYPIDLPQNQESLDLVSGVLKALDFKFSDDLANIDTTTKNAARITKFYGTTAKKGDDLPPRPHRPSKILEAPDNLGIVSREQLEAVAAMKPIVVPPSRNGRPFRKNSPGEFDLPGWISRHQVPIRREGPWREVGYRYILEECPWNGHTDNAAYIVRGKEGWIAAGCQHNSCQGRGWRDLREHYEPGAYDQETWPAEKCDGDDSNDSEFRDLVELPDPEDLPLEALSPILRRFVREAAESIGCPVDYLGLSVLAALSAAIGDTRRIVIKKEWTEGAAIYAMIVGDPASKKTPAINLAMKPVRDRQMELKAKRLRQ